MIVIHLITERKLPKIHFNIRTFMMKAYDLYILNINFGIYHNWLYMITLVAFFIPCPKILIFEFLFLGCEFWRFVKFIYGLLFFIFLFMFFELEKVENELKGLFFILFRNVHQEFYQVVDENGVVQKNWFST